MFIQLYKSSARVNTIKSSKLLLHVVIQHTPSIKKIPVYIITHHHSSCKLQYTSNVLIWGNYKSLKKETLFLTSSYPTQCWVKSCQSSGSVMS